MMHLSIEILQVVGVFLFPILFIAYFYVRGKATNVEIAKMAKSKELPNAEIYFLKKELGKRGSWIFVKDMKEKIEKKFEKQSEEAI